MRIGVCYCSLKDALKSIRSSQSGSIYQIDMDLQLSRLTIMMPHLWGGLDFVCPQEEVSGSRCQGRPCVQPTPNVLQQPDLLVYINSLKID